MLAREVERGEAVAVGLLRARAVTDQREEHLDVAPLARHVQGGAAARRACPAHVGAARSEQLDHHDVALLAGDREGREALGRRCVHVGATVIKERARRVSAAVLARNVQGRRPVLIAQRRVGPMSQQQLDRLGVPAQCRVHQRRAPERQRRRPVDCGRVASEVRAHGARVAASARHVQVGRGALVADARSGEADVLLKVVLAVIDEELVARIYRSARHIVQEHRLLTGLLPTRRPDVLSHARLQRRDGVDVAHRIGQAVRFTVAHMRAVERPSVLASRASRRHHRAAVPPDRLAL